MRQEILVEREKTHGNFKMNAEIWMELRGAASIASLSESQQLALIMIYVKVARILSGQGGIVDHWMDIAGYANLAAESCEEQH